MEHRPFEIDEIDIDEIEIDEIDDIDEIEAQRLRKRYIRDFENPFERFYEHEFKRRFRFTKDAVLHGVLPKIRNGLEKPDNRGLPIAPEIQLLIALRFYANGSFQAVYGDLEHVSQPSVSRVIFRVSVLLASLIRDTIKMPGTPQARTENWRLFEEIGTTRDTVGLPNVDGAIDCTHVKLVHTNLQQVQEVYRNRKGYFSLNVQAVVGPNMEFLDIVPEFPGSSHDSRIFQNSRLYVRYEEREFNGYLLGDAGYPCLPFMMTPVANPRNRAEEKYNYVHSRTRMTVERVFGVWKRRFPCLSRGLGTKLLTSTTVVVACAVLHNMARHVDEAMPQEEEEEQQGDVEEEPPLHPDAPERRRQPGEGFAVRTALIARLF